MSLVTCSSQRWQEKRSRSTVLATLFLHTTARSPSPCQLQQDHRAVYLTLDHSRLLCRYPTVFRYSSVLRRERPTHKTNSRRSTWRSATRSIHARVASHG